MGCMLFFQRLSRKKHLMVDTVGTSNLKRCLNIVDLTALGVGSTLGLGIYVLAGQVAKDEAGPAVIISFFVAAVASFFAGICYAEFGSRVPKAGSAYIYSYVTVGEFVAFVIGWNLILEYVIGAASVARGYSGYLDSLIDYKMQEAFRRAMPINAKGISAYPDFFAFGITFVLAIVLAIGVKESSKLNNVLTVVNLFVVVYAVICGAFQADVYNWEIPSSKVPAGYGSGGFFPYGASGVIAGAATCFYGFVGFDCIATTGEEAKDPQKSIPIAILLSLLVVFLSYFGVSTVVTLMVPYYYQDADAPIPYAFDSVGYPIAKWIVSIGALFGLSTSLLGAMFPLPRVLYAMSSDGLIFRFMSTVNERFKTPFVATIIAGAFAAAMALIFDTDALVDMMSIGTLLAYTLVAASVLILRYKPDESEILINEGSDDSNSVNAKNSSASVGFVPLCRQLINLDRLKTPTLLTSTIVTWTTLVMGIFLLGFNAIIIFASSYISDCEPWAVFLTVFFGVISILLGVIIGLQPPNRKSIAFKVPWVPFIPALSFFANTHLMLMLNVATWIRFGIWMAIGSLIYGFYGIWNSSEEYRSLGMQPPGQKSYMFSEESRSLMVDDDSD